MRTRKVGEEKAARTPFQKFQESSYPVRESVRAVGYTCKLLFSGTLTSIVSRNPPPDVQHTGQRG